ncbi:conserved unknown protein [Ectocarpus siliculosus]|uniref:DEK-C domain-containing protein n=1 Tax=Ectocarpus siliculosus TaxID=2880 RepID=D8LDB6_ECTSI|nr:conserved unknown protein [Ectocarpus siliculosus]|eukprot:CBN80174.1 conserved unknown protein [Ectocarpus siliculosus]
MASSSDSTALPSAGTLRREISTFLRAAADPNALTFKQVRLAVEESLGLPEGSLHKGFKSQIKEAVHSVMDDIEADRAKTTAKEEEEEEEEEEFVDDTTRSAAPAPSHIYSSRGDTDDRSAIPKNSSTKRKVATGSGGEDASGDKHSNRNSGNKTDAAGNGKEVGTKEGKKQKKDIRKTGGEDGGDGDLVCVLGETKSARKQVNVRTWNKRTLVDIREFYLKEAKEYRPGKKGMSLNPSQWEILRSAAGQIDANIRRLA